MNSHPTLRELAEDLASEVTTPGAVVENALERVHAAEPAIRAWVHVDAEGARSAARRLEDSENQGTTGSRGLLWGIPVGIKDLIDVEGLATACGSKLRGGSAAQDDAECVRLLRRAGAVVMGKTVTTEFGYFAPGPTRNPANPAHTPGGSSSGSAAAVAAGTIPLAVGTQTAGSLTRPASFCGVAGFVAPTGQFSMAGITGLSHSLDSLGFLARTVADLHFAWAALLGSTANTTDAADDSWPRLLLWNGSDLGEVSPDMSAAVELAAAAINREAAECVAWSNPAVVQQLAAAHGTVMAFEAARERTSELDHVEDLSAPLAELLTGGAAMPEHDYSAAREAITAARREVLAILEPFDAILGPAALGAAPAGIEATGNPVLSRPWQALGLPVVTIPGLRDSQGMPMGLQLIGRPGCEHRLFSIAERIEETLASLAPTQDTELHTKTR